MSTHIEQRALVDGVWNVVLTQLTSELEVALPGKSFRLRANGTNLTGDFDDVLTAGEIAIWQTAVTDHKAAFSNLPAAKEAKINEIDQRTDYLISLGFTYAAKQFSLSLSAQSKMTAAHQIKDSPAFVYPVVWNTMDDQDKYSIASAADMDGFYLTAIGTIRTHLDSGTVIKDSVRAAIDLAGVSAVVDNR